MLRLLAFDMDGTLVQSEVLKARSYGRAAAELDPTVDADAVAAAYGAECVGWSREHITQHLMGRFGLEDAARARVGPGVEVWHGYSDARLRHYRAMLDDADLVRSMARPEVLALVETARQSGLRTGLATTSDAHHTSKVLAALGLAGAFDAVVTYDDVTATKPDPEAYLVLLGRVGIPAETALALEDSPAGIRAALAAGLRCLALPTPYTRAGVRRLTEAGRLDPADVVDDLARLGECVGEAA